ncbi:MAG: DUF58 domain-containing protein [Pseudomonadota bacterium]
MWFERVGQWPIFSGLRVRVNDWANRRIKRQGATVITHGRSIYVLPTRFGFILAALVLVLLLGAMNYSNSMAFMLAFLVASIAILGMHYTYANLVRLALTPRPCPAIYAGQRARFGIEVKPLNGRAREALWLGEPGDEQSAGSSRDGLLHFVTPELERGRFRLSRLRLWTCYPFGLFFVWSWLRFADELSVLVYPAPEDFGMAYRDTDDSEGKRSAAVAGDDDFAGIRRYQTTDSPKRVAWKSLAHSNQWLSKHFEGNVSEMRWFDYAWLESLSPERRLSQLCHWVLESEREGVPYGLKLPGCVIELGTGARHQHQCLEALALFEVDS